MIVREWGLSLKQLEKYLEVVFRSYGRQDEKPNTRTARLVQ